MISHQATLSQDVPNQEYAVAWRDRRFVVSSAGVTLTERDETLARFSLDEMEAIYHVAAGSDVFASDFEFTVFVFVQHYIVVPGEFFFAVKRPFEALATRLDAAPLLWDYAVVSAPRVWCTLRLNPLRTPAVRLALYDRGTLARHMRDWQRVRGPRTLTEYQDAGITTADHEDYQRRFWQAEFSKD